MNPDYRPPGVYVEQFSDPTEVMALNYANSLDEHPPREGQCRCMDTASRSAVCNGSSTGEDGLCRDCHKNGHGRNGDKEFYIMPQSSSRRVIG